MPKATRANDNQETPKKRSRKTQPANGNGANAVEPVTTAPAIAETTPVVVAQQEQDSAKKSSRNASPAAATAVEPVQPVTAGPASTTTEVAAKVSASKQAVAPLKHNGHVSEEVVRRRAYELYLQRRGQGGSPEQDWFQALQEISGQHVA